MYLCTPVNGYGLEWWHRSDYPSRRLEDSPPLHLATSRWLACAHTHTHTHTHTHCIVSIPVYIYHSGMYNRHALAVNTLSKEGLQAYRATGDSYTYIGPVDWRGPQSLYVVSNGHDTSEDDFREAMCALSFSARLAWGLQSVVCYGILIDIVQDW